MVLVPESNYIFTLGRLQRPVSGVHSIMMEASEGGGCTPTPFHYIHHHAQNCGVRSRADTVLLFVLYPYMYSVGGRAIGRVGPELMYMKLPMFLFFYIALGLNDSDAGKSVTQAIGRGGS
jgi:hypothetical protein